MIWVEPMYVIIVFNDYVRSIFFSETSNGVKTISRTLTLLFQFLIISNRSNTIQKLGGGASKKLNFFLQ